MGYKGVIFSHNLFRFHLHFVNKQNKMNKEIYRYLFIHIQGRAALIHFDLCSIWAALRDSTETKLAVSSGKDTV